MTEQQPEPWTPTPENPGLDHDRDGDRWEAHTPGPKRDRQADWDTRTAIRRERRSECDADGNPRSSTWSSDFRESTCE